MNDVVFSSAAKASFTIGSVKRFLWDAASRVALGGLYIWEMENHWVLVQKMPMRLRGLGKAFDGATIAHISDLHLSPVVREGYLMRFVKAINELEVDFVAITGDMVTGPRNYARRVAKVLSHLRPKVATLACLGNHDYGMWHPSGLGGIRGLAPYLSSHLVDAGVSLLNNDSHIFRRDGQILQFVGVEDLWSQQYDPATACRHLDVESPIVALVHNPDAAPDLAARGAQYVLAGHTHGKDTRRRLIRTLVLPSKQRQFVVGQYALGLNKFLYVNRGLGHSMRFQFDHRPEITIFQLQGES